MNKFIASVWNEIKRIGISLLVVFLITFISWKLLGLDMQKVLWIGYCSLGIQILVIILEKLKLFLIKILLYHAIFVMGVSWTISYTTEVSHQNSVYVGCAIWIVLISFFFDRFYKSPKEDTGEIYENSFMFRGSPVLSSANEITRPRNQRAIFAGPNLLLPWERLVGKPISLATNVPISGCVTAQANDKIKLTIKWTASFGAIPTQDILFFPLVEEEIVKNRVTSDISLYIESWVQGAPYHTDVLNNSKKFFDHPDRIPSLFAGDKFDSETEIKTGRYVKNVAVSSVTLEETTQNIQEALANSKKVAEIVQSIASITGLSQLSQHAAIVAALNSGGQINDNVLNILGGNRGNSGKSKGKGGNETK